MAISNDKPGKDNKEKSLFDELKNRFYNNLWVLLIVFFIILLMLQVPMGIAIFLAFTAFILTGQFLFNLPYNTQNQTSSYSNSLDSYQAYNNHLAILMAAVIKADKVISQAEIDYVDKRIKKEYFRRDAAAMIKTLKHELDKDVIVIKHILEQVDENYTISEKVQVLHILASLAVTDCMLTTSEEQLLQTITRGFGLPYRTLDSILAMFKFRREYDESKHSKSKTISQSLLTNAYEILNIEISATNQEIKKAYKKLAVIHHPDKVAHMGEDVQKAAAEKFKTIVAAYDLICKKKGIV